MFRRDVRHTGKASIQTAARPLLAPPRLGSNGEAELTVSGEAGRDYVISASTNLVDWAVLTNVFSTNATLQIRDSAAGNFKHRFYRALSN